MNLRRRGQTTFSRLCFLLWAAVGLATLPLAIGCETSSTPRRRPQTANSLASSDKDHLALAMETLPRFQEIEPGEYQRQVLYHLNRWIDAQSSDDAWRRDPLVERLPRRFQDWPEWTELDAPVFLPDDTRYLTEVYLLRSVARWVSEDTARRWMEKQQEAAGAGALVREQATDSPEHRLEEAKALFDWTIRHIQLEPLPPYPTTPSTAGNSQPPAERATPPELAIPGPGYRFYPHQVLLYGLGDAWQRSRVFILLARQRGLDAVMLAVNDRGEGSRPNVWCPAVLIDNKLYLFDTALGLPILGAKAGSIATLDEVLADPSVLRNLDEQDNDQKLIYPVAAEDLQRVAALVDADPEALSRRMQMLEDRLTGERLLELAVSPSEIARRVRACPGLAGVNVRLWTLPLETRIYRKSLERMARRDPEMQRRLLQEEGAYVPSVREGRHLHLLGRIAGEEDAAGAIQKYLESRKADQLIDEVATSEEARRQIGLPPLPPELTPQQRQMALAIQVSQLRLNKQHASYWLGLAQFDLEQYETAINWLKDRTLDAFPDGVWTGGARYNLGRTYEALGRIDDARRLYFQSQSPQRHGDLLRARLLRESR